MSFKRMLGVSFIVSLALWAWFSWPLPRHALSGIPTAGHREKAEIQPMVPGDPLQFMYYCWLAGDMLRGKTPLFYNLYEFNTGNDRERFEPDSYYIPFSLIYAAGAGLAGRAFGWNLTGLLAIWGTYLLTWLLVRRWTNDEWIAVGAALLGIALPFRWLNLFGGSPAGFAMVWIPAILLGVDLAVREDRIRGGILAGTAILLAAWTDQHVYFFGTLAVPVWCLAAFAARPDFQWRGWRAYGRLLVALLPVALFLAAALLFPKLMKWLSHAVTGLAPVAHAVGPRSPREVQIYSPDWLGFFGDSTLGISEQIYIGALPLAFLAAGWLALLGLTIYNAVRQIIALRGAARLAKQAGAGEERTTHFPSSEGQLTTPCPSLEGQLTTLFPSSEGQGVGSKLWPDLKSSQAWFATWALPAMTIIVLAILGVMILSLGFRGPRHSAAYEFIRKLIPPYALIRQPAKIFCLLPSFLAVASALALTALVQLRAVLAAPGAPVWKHHAWRILLPAVFIGLILGDYVRRVNPTLSLLETKQEAYAAAAADAAAAQTDPRALVIPLWPGDSHYASIYQYFASLYRVRMINGYNPFIKKGYLENVFRRFESVNQGGLAAGQIEDLANMNCRYLILHENLFPEKVSPFPVTATLRQFLVHPRLELLRQDGSVWAFKIMDAPRVVPATTPAWQPLFAARRFELERYRADRRASVGNAPNTGGRAYVTLVETNAGVQTPPIRVAAVTNLHWLVRARGQGRLAGETLADQAATPLAPVPVQAADWTWLNVPVPAYEGFSALSLKLVVAEGAVDLDLALLTAGPWPELPPGEALVLPAPLFFHAGHINPRTGGVVFRQDHDSPVNVFYGPKLPLAKGTYAVEIAFTSPAPAGAELGTINLEQNEATGEGVAVPVVAGRPAQGRWQQAANLPFNLVLLYFARADLEIRSITFTRLD